MRKTIMRMLYIMTLLFLPSSMQLYAQGLTYNVTVPAGTKACYITGGMNNWSFTEMTRVDDLHYTIVIPEATRAHKYKYSSGPSEKYIEKSATGGNVSNRSYDNDDTVYRWASIYTPTVVEDTIKESIEIYLEKITAYDTTYIYAWDGPSAGEWPGTAMCNDTIVNNVAYYKHTFVSPQTAVNIMFHDGGDNKTIDIKGVTSTTYYRLNSTTGITDVTIVQPGDVVVSPDTITPSDTLTYRVTVPQHTPACYIAGEMNDWGFTTMTKIDDTHYTLSLDNATKAMKYKYTCDTSWSCVETQADGITDIAYRTWSENDTVAEWRKEIDKRFTINNIHYIIITDNQVAVTCQGDNYDTIDNEYTDVVVIPDSVVYNETTYYVTFIEDEAFRDCTTLTSITTPATITAIGKYAFASCTGLTKIQSLATTPPIIESTTFIGVNKTIPLIVPMGCIESYNEAPYWNEFTQIIHEGMLGISDKTTNNNTTITVVAGRLHIDGIDSDAIIHIYNTNGILLYRTTAQSIAHIELPVGIYLIPIYNTTHKVAVP